MATGNDAVEWAREGAERGAGEILLTSMDRDGTKDGYDIELTRAVADAVDIPVIASGGAGRLEHLSEAISERPRRRRLWSRRSSTTGSTACARPRSTCDAAGHPGAAPS